MSESQCETRNSDYSFVLICSFKCYLKKKIIILCDSSYITAAGHQLASQQLGTPFGHRKVTQPRATQPALQNNLNYQKMGVLTPNLTIRGDIWVSKHLLWDVLDTTCDKRRGQHWRRGTECRAGGLRTSLPLGQIQGLGCSHCCCSPRHQDTAG